MDVGYNGELIPRHSGGKGTVSYRKQVNPQVIRDIYNATPDGQELVKSIGRAADAVYNVSEAYREHDYKVDSLKMSEDFQVNLDAENANLQQRYMNGEFQTPDAYMAAQEEAIQRARDTTYDNAFGSEREGKSGYMRNAKANGLRASQTLDTLQGRAMHLGMQNYMTMQKQYRDNQIDAQYQYGLQAGGTTGAQIVRQTVANDYRVPNDMKNYVAATKTVPLIANAAREDLTTFFNNAMSDNLAGQIRNAYATSATAAQDVERMKQRSFGELDNLVLKQARRLDEEFGALKAGVTDERQIAALSKEYETQFKQIASAESAGRQAMSRWYESLVAENEAKNAAVAKQYYNGKLQRGENVAPDVQALIDACNGAETEAMRMLDEESAQMTHEELEEAFVREWRCSPAGALGGGEGIPIICGAEEYYDGVSSAEEAAAVTKTLLLWGAVSKDSKGNYADIKRFTQIMHCANRLLPYDDAQAVKNECVALLKGGKLPSDAVNYEYEQATRDLYALATGDDDVSSAEVKDWLETDEGRQAMRVAIALKPMLARAPDMQSAAGLRKSAVESFRSRLEKGEARDWARTAESVVGMLSGGGWSEAEYALLSRGDISFKAAGVPGAPLSGGLPVAKSEDVARAAQTIRHIAGGLASATKEDRKHYDAVKKAAEATAFRQMTYNNVRKYAGAGISRDKQGAAAVTREHNLLSREYGKLVDALRAAGYVGKKEWPSVDDALVLAHNLVGSVDYANAQAARAASGYTRAAMAKEGVVTAEEAKKKQKEAPVWSSESAYGPAPDYSEADSNYLD